MRLTDISVRSLQGPLTGSKVYADDTLTGFGVRVTAKGVKAYVLTYGANRERVTLGRVGLLGLADARKIARERLAELTLGKHRPARLKMGDALEWFFTEKEAQCRPATLRLYRGIFNRDYKHLHGKPLGDITAGDITGVTDGLLHRGLPSAANHTLVAGKVFFSWCARRGYIPHSPVQYLTPPSKETSRERVLSDEELRVVWKAAETIGYPVGIITQLLILTGARRSEIGSLKAEWCSLPNSLPSLYLLENTDCEVSSGSPMQAPSASAAISQRQCTITIPASHSKNKRQHRFPIGGRTSSILESLSARPGLLFAARRKNVPFNSWSAAKKELDAKVAEILTNQGQISSRVSSWTFHDLRRTYATTLHRLGVKLEVVEAILNHVSGANSGIVRVYNRHRYEAEMREAVQLYESWLQRLIARV